jgi:hypothetical protein
MLTRSSPNGRVMTRLAEKDSLHLIDLGILFKSDGHLYSHGFTDVKH